MQIACEMSIQFISMHIYIRVYIYIYHISTYVPYIHNWVGVWGLLCDTMRHVATIGEAYTHTNAALFAFLMHVRELLAYTT